MKYLPLSEPFAGYAFNKAHSVSYALIAYQTAYLKANFPSEYMTAFLIGNSDDHGKNGNCHRRMPAAGDYSLAAGY